MNRLVVSAVLVCGIMAAVFAQPRTDAVMSHTATGQPVLKAYLLSAAEEACFSKTDGARTCFWAAWDQGTTCDRATIQGIQDNLAWGPVPDNTDDEEITVKAAYGTAGVYLLFEVKDNVWLGFVERGAARVSP